MAAPRLDPIPTWRRRPGGCRARPGLGPVCDGDHLPDDRPVRDGEVDGLHSSPACRLHDDLPKVIDVNHRPSAVFWVTHGADELLPGVDADQLFVLAGELDRHREWDVAVRRCGVFDSQVGHSRVSPVKRVRITEAAGTVWCDEHLAELRALQPVLPDVAYELGRDHPSVNRPNYEPPSDDLATIALPPRTGPPLRGLAYRRQG